MSESSPVESVPIGDDDESPAALVISLLAALDAAGVTYCHWKSNEAIGRSLSAHNDLDLLVSREHGPEFNAILHGLGFRVARPSPGRLVPGMVDHFGLDTATRRIVHVQAHYQLVLGDDMTKNFRLPIEDTYLASGIESGPIRIADPTIELLVFVLRMTVKHCPLDAQIARRGRLTISERRELADLESRSDPRELDRFRSELTPFVSAKMFARCRSAIAPHAGRLLRARTGRELLRSLEPYGRSGRSVDLGLRVWRRWRRRRQGDGPASRRAPDCGGLTIAVIGGDGSGKSSAVKLLGDTLGRHFPTEVHHLGKPERSLASRVVRRLMRGMPRVNGQTITSLPSWTDFDSVGFPGYRYLLFHLFVARDRARACQRVRRAAAAGRLAICDRFPLPEIERMDSPRCTGVHGSDTRPVARWIARLERRYYDSIGRPDVLIVLRVAPTLAVNRRSEQDREFVSRRAQEVWEHDWSSTPGAVVIDASRAHSEVLAEVYSAAWSAI